MFDKFMKGIGGYIFPSPVSSHNNDKNNNPSSVSTSTSTLSRPPIFSSTSTRVLRSQACLKTSTIQVSDPGQGKPHLYCARSTDTNLHTNTNRDIHNKLTLDEISNTAAETSTKIYIADNAVTRTTTTIKKTTNSSNMPTCRITRSRNTSPSRMELADNTLIYTNNIMTGHNMNNESSTKLANNNIPNNTDNTKIAKHNHNDDEEEDNEESRSSPRIRTRITRSQSKNKDVQLQLGVTMKKDNQDENVMATSASNRKPSFHFNSNQDEELMIIKERMNTRSRLRSSEVNPKSIENFTSSNNSSESFNIHTTESKSRSRGGINQKIHFHEEYTNKKNDFRDDIVLHPNNRVHQFQETTLLQDNHLTDSNNLSNPQKNNLNNNSEKKKKSPTNRNKMEEGHMKIENRKNMDILISRRENHVIETEKRRKSSQLTTMDQVKDSNEDIAKERNTKKMTENSKTTKEVIVDNDGKKSFEERERTTEKESLSTEMDQVNEEEDAVIEKCIFVKTYSARNRDTRYENQKKDGVDSRKRKNQQANEYSEKRREYLPSSTSQYTQCNKEIIETPNQYSPMSQKNIIVKKGNEVKQNEKLLKGKNENIIISNKTKVSSTHGCIGKDETKRLEYEDIQYDMPLCHLSMNNLISNINVEKGDKKKRKESEDDFNLSPTTEANKKRIWEQKGSTCKLCNTYFTYRSNFSRHKKTDTHKINALRLLEKYSLKYKAKYKAFFARVILDRILQSGERKGQTTQTNLAEKTPAVVESISKRCESCNIDFTDHQQYCEHFQSTMHIQRSVSSLFSEKFLPSVKTNDRKDDAISANPSRIVTSSVVHGGGNDSKFLDGNEKMKYQTFIENEKVKDDKTANIKGTMETKIQNTREEKVCCQDCEKYLAISRYNKHINSKEHKLVVKTKTLLYQSKYEDFTEYDPSSFPIRDNSGMKFILNVEEFEKRNRPKRNAPSLFPFEDTSDQKKPKLNSKEEVRIPGFRLVHFNPSRHDNPEDLSRIYQEMLDERNETHEDHRKHIPSHIDVNINPSSQFQAFSTLLSQNRRSLRLVEANEEDLNMDN